VISATGSVSGGGVGRRDSISGGNCGELLNGTIGLETLGGAAGTDGGGEEDDIDAGAGVERSLCFLCGPFLFLFLILLLPLRRKFLLRWAGFRCPT